MVVGVLLDRLRRRDPLCPPRRLAGSVGDSDFIATGDEFLSHFVALAGLAPDERVLDIGCGVGRMARPLLGHLDERGSYDGFDLVPEAIAWCRERYPADRFRFALLDVHNARYHPAGTRPAEEARFPYPDGAFDFAFAASVFTHLLPAPVERYLAETARVLRPGGRALLTFFLAEEPAWRLVHPFAEALVADPDLPEEAIGYREAWVRERIAVAGMTVRDPVHHGGWSGRPDALSFQDIVVVERP
jgi:SAM-dependent methyltransferase